MAAAAILNYYFVTTDYLRSPFALLNSPFKFCVYRVHTFRDIAIWKFYKFGLKCLFRPPKIMFWGSFNPLNFTFYYRNPQNTSLRRNTRFEFSLVVIRPTVWSGRGAKCTKKKEPKVSQNSPFSQTSFPSSHINQILHARSYSGYFSWFRVSEKSVKNVGAVGSRIFVFPIDLAHRLYTTACCYRTSCDSPFKPLAITPLTLTCSMQRKK